MAHDVTQIKLAGWLSLFECCFAVCNILMLTVVQDKLVSRDLRADLVDPAYKVLPVPPVSTVLLDSQADRVGLVS